MIIAESDEHYRMITQNDHGDLAGQFAAHWGNEQFARLKPYQSMVLAAETHDNGWWDWDVYPSVDEQGVPRPSPERPAKLDRASTARASTTSLAAISMPA